MCTDAARAIIDANAYLTLGTVNADGTPWVSPVYFNHEGYRIFHWTSVPDALHSRNLVACSAVSMVIFDSSAAVYTAEAIYLRAVAEQVPDDELEVAVAVTSPPRFAGARALTVADLREPSPYRAYRATVTEAWIKGRANNIDIRIPLSLPHPAE